ncbi:hypothetical protein BS78_08G024600 [Paspalum vaginatum]|nr:hypothetical protein BS78_08G024600 [Paspalum vaginatum]
MVGERVLAEGEEHEAAPLGEGGRSKIENDGHESAHVEDAEGLRMEGSNGVGIAIGGGTIVGVDIAGGVAVRSSVSFLEPAACIGEVAFAAGDFIKEFLAVGGSSVGLGLGLGCVCGCGYGVGLGGRRLGVKDGIDGHGEQRAEDRKPILIP